MAICLVCAVYYNCGVVVDYLSHNYTDEITIVDGQESLPLSNVTICADVTINKMHIKTVINVPDELALKVAKATGYTKSEFFDRFIEWIAVTIEVHRDVPIHLMRYFAMLIEVNISQMSHYSQFLRSVMTQCRDMLKSCQFAGQFFDCCKNAVTLIDDSGVCYQIAVSNE